MIDVELSKVEQRCTQPMMHLAGAAVCTFDGTGLIDSDKRKQKIALVVLPISNRNACNEFFKGWNGHTRSDDDPCYSRLNAD